MMSKGRGNENHAASPMKNKERRAPAVMASFASGPVSEMDR